MTTADPGSSGDDASTALPRSIGAPATRALAGAGVTNLDQLTEFREADLLALHGLGPKALRLLRDALAERGQSFAGA